MAFSLAKIESDMTYWGDSPWDNDCAADWCTDVFGKTKLHEEIGACLEQELTEESRDEIRAAIMMFILLGRVYVYDTETYSRHATLALKQARELLKHWLEGGWDNDSEIGESISHEIKILERRMKSTPEYIDQPEEELVAYWSRWM